MLCMHVCMLCLLCAHVCMHFLHVYEHTGMGVCMLRPRLASSIMLDCFATVLVESRSLGQAQRALVCLISIASLFRGLGGGIYLKGNRCQLGTLSCTVHRMWDCTAHHATMV